MRFIFLYGFLHFLTRSAFSNTVTFSEEGGSLVIKPRYTPFIPTFTIRSIIGIMAGGVLIVAISSLWNHRRFDEEMIAILFFLFLSGYVLWSLIRSTRQALQWVAPITIIDRNNREILIGKDRHISFDNLQGLLLTNENIKDQYHTIRVAIVHDQRNHHSGDTICYMTYRDKEFMTTFHRLMRLLLNYILPRSENTADYLISVDWENLKLTVGYNVYIPINGELDDLLIPSIYIHDK